MLDILKVIESRGGMHLAGPDGPKRLFVLASGRIADGYVMCDVLSPWPLLMQEIASKLLTRLPLAAIDGFVCPAVGEIPLLTHMALAASQLMGRQLPGVWADKDDKRFVINRHGHAAAIRGRKVAVLIDRLATDSTTKKVMDAACACGATPIAVGTIVGVSRLPTELPNVAVHALSTADIKSYAPDDVPAEWRQLPIVTDEPLGHGHELEAAQTQTGKRWPGGFVSIL